MLFTMPVHAESYIVVAEAPFIPTMGGGEREHLGFVQTLVRRGELAALVIPTDADPARAGRADDLAAIRTLVHPAPVFETQRSRSALAALHATPYVHRSRPFSVQEARMIWNATPAATGIIGFSYKVAHIARTLSELSGLPAVIRMHNQEGKYFRAIADSSHGPAKALALLESVRIKHDEQRLEKAEWHRGLADISRRDAEDRARRTTRPVAYVPTFALGPQHERMPIVRHPAVDHPVLLFLGALDVRTNIDAVTWFAGEAWDQVRQSHPEAVWHIVGRDPLPEVQALANPSRGIEVYANAPDPNEHYATASVAINPAVSGSGVNIKLVEYLAAGVPVVSTTKGMDGLDLHAGTDLLVADAPTQFADRVVDLLSSADLSREISLAGQSKAYQILDVDTSAKMLFGMLR